MVQDETSAVRSDTSVKDYFFRNREKMLRERSGIRKEMIVKYEFLPHSYLPCNISTILRTFLQLVLSKLKKKVIN